MSHIYSHQQQQTSDNNPSSPLLTISILCILGASALFLLAYYVFLNNKCSSSFPFLNLIMTSTEPAAAEDDSSSFIALSPTNWTRTIGLDDLAIQDLPTRHYYHHTTTETATATTVDHFKCVVCLNDFHEHDILRVLPNCAHSFHLDCIDVWLHSNSNCPICRTGINSCSSSSSAFGFIAPMSSPQREAESVIGSDEDFVVIELGGGNGVVRSDSMRRKQSPSIGKQSTSTEKQGKQRRNASIMGDEGIDLGGDRFMVDYPMRRSFSWGSAADRKLLSSVRAVMVRQNSQSNQAESSSSSSRGRRLFLPFGKIRGSRNNNAVTPLKSDVCV
ncbi:RING-H2 finger protein ATL1 [Linum grandiflorum]